MPTPMSTTFSRSSTRASASRGRPSPRPSPPTRTAAGAMLFALTMLLGGCAVTRVDPPAPVQAPAQFKEDGLWKQARPAAAEPVPEQWWTLFGDPVLDDLQHRLVIGNENLKAAVAQVTGARAALEASRSAFFPTLSAGFSGTRSASPDGNVTNGSINRGPTNSVQASLNASWELDLWGRLRLASEGANASLQASADDLAAARLSAQATLAQTYFSLRTAEAQEALYDRSVKAYERFLSLTQARYDSGVAARGDVLQAQTQLRTAQAQLLETRSTRGQLEHAIAVLLGLPPSALAVSKSAALPQAPEVPAMLPSQLLERRPDIAAAQRRVAVAYAQIGVADAAYFPSLTLSASGGYRNNTLSNLLSAPNLFWSVGPSLAAAIFDGGQRKLASAQARTSAEVATSTYRQTVLTALQEVEDNLILADHLREEARLQQEALESAQRNLQLVTDQYKAGTVSFLDVTTAQNSAFNAEASLLSVRNRQLAAINLLLKNVAGRWTPA
ncbi:efflux transporter outer membrane subunit [Mitsuaria sp. GD03876]|uniref:efflux transporter outer membrane subunit n=1 Tax=Mitsuaria sp. GD03876 TaxID=2975399 RepID=UPI00244C4113|nr:efflux transporter outer membrane subunit [Mitsuaria sp. GD03876]MDH0864737.1 efflux transporter outer membrane subunit [Mitsuaria sp. GD03876]